ncbi:MAG: DNA-3-methyladenine glycosylase [Bacteroidales bacterium]|nr:DNA-3-methyladenine glycosylase [Bacteroidales bacterium]
MILDKSFYIRADVVAISKELLGKYLYTSFDGHITGGIITETEAYAGPDDRASHAYGNRRTKRTEIMFREGGIAYVYLCYGIHSLFNIVTNKAEIPHAILIRGLQPTDGLATMLKRAGKNKVNKNLANGPGKVTKILGIHYTHTGLPISRSSAQDYGLKIWLEDKGLMINQNTITETKRVGVDYAGVDAKLPYRFIIPWQ